MKSPGFERVERLVQRLGADHREALGQRLGGVLGHDRDPPLKEDGAGVHAGVHQHRRDAGGPQARQQRVLHRARPAERPDSRPRCI